MFFDDSAVKSTGKINGGVKRDRTADLLNAIQALSQLSYAPESDALRITESSLSDKLNFGVGRRIFEMGRRILRDFFGWFGGVNPGDGLTGAKPEDGWGRPAGTAAEEGLHLGAGVLELTGRCLIISSKVRDSYAEFRKYAVFQVDKG